MTTDAERDESSSNIDSPASESKREAGTKVTKSEFYGRDTDCLSELTKFVTIALSFGLYRS